MTFAPGIHDLPSDGYHADPCDRPSLTASTIKTLTSRSPFHAWSGHPRLNPRFERVTEDKFDLGTAVHQLLLEGDDAMYVVEANDWRTNAAKEAREYAREVGRVPMLAAHANEARQMVEAIWAQIARHDARPPLFQNGKPEQTIVWEEDGVLCRARLDWLHDDYSAINDLKSTKASAEPRAWSKTLLSIGGDIQCRFYVRGVKALTGIEPDFSFVVAECQPPFAISVVGLAPSLAALADAKIDYALRTWKRCLETDTWPGYPTRVAYVETTAWAEADFLAREAEEEIAA